MNHIRSMVSVLLLAAFVPSAWALPAKATPGGQQSWGPSWISGGPPGANPRPAKFDQPITRARVFDDQSRIGLGVRFWCDGQVTSGHQYQLLCQLRVHTKKGEEGPLLGTAAQSAGSTMYLAGGTADDSWNGLEGSVDITRKELTSMTNLPKGKVTAVRIEPQLFDETTGKYVTAVKTDAIIVMVSAGDNGRVDAVMSLANWIQQNGQYNSDKVLDVLNDLDVYDAEGNNIAEALGSVLNIKELSPQIRLRYLSVISKPWVHMKHPALWEALTALSNSDDKEVSARAQQLLK